MMRTNFWIPSLQRVAITGSVCTELVTHPVVILSTGLSMKVAFIKIGNQVSLTMTSQMSVLTKTSSSEVGITYYAQQIAVLCVNSSTTDSQTIHAMKATFASQLRMNVGIRAYSLKVSTNVLLNCVEMALHASTVLETTHVSVQPTGKVVTVRRMLDNALQE